MWMYFYCAAPETPLGLQVYRFMQSDAVNRHSGTALLKQHFGIVVVCTANEPDKLTQLAVQGSSVSFDDNGPKFTSSTGAVGLVHLTMLRDPANLDFGLSFVCCCPSSELPARTCVLLHFCDPFLSCSSIPSRDRV